MKIENDKLIFDNSNIKRKKITGHSFVDMAGLNPYAKIGDVVLERLGYLKQDVPEKYLLRGDYAEKIVRAIYERDGHKCTIYDKDKIHYDNMPENKDFGGLIDIDLLEENSLVEVKSKSMSDYDKILREKPAWEVMQGCYYAYLKGKESFTMEWIFFDPLTEREVFANQPVTTLANLKRISQKYNMNEKTLNYTKGLLDKVLNYYNKCLSEGAIPLEDISDRALEQLGLERPQIDFMGEIGATLFGTLTF